MYFKISVIYWSRSGRDKKPNRTGRTEPNRSTRNRTEPNRTESSVKYCRTELSEPARIGRGNEPNRSRPSHDASEKRRPIRFEPGNLIFRTEPNRLIFEKSEPKRIEPNRFLPGRCLGLWLAGRTSGSCQFSPVSCGTSTANLPTNTT